ncbi:MAG: tRNA epoxyqueuosine(34) reductase QueG [Rhodospirillaceae bacterium]
MRAAIRAEALALGFDAVGFAPAALGDGVKDALAGFLAAGYHGEMAWLAESAARRRDPRGLWPDARTVIALGMNYGPGPDGPIAADRGAISVYARGRDYHDVVKKRLKRLAGWLHRQFRHEVKVFVDTAPVLEKPLAALAGLGWQGRHTNLVSRDFGSWLFLGEIYTTLDLPPDPPAVDRCGRCVRCLEVCPTRAFTGPYRLDARRCVSYLTIEHAGPIPLALRPHLGNRIYGCDDCLAVCPWNRFAQACREQALLPRADLTRPRLAELARLDDTGFRALFSGSPVKRIGRDRFLRNVLIAIGNSGAPELAPVAAALGSDPNPVVAEAADWAVGRLGSGRPQSGESSALARRVSNSSPVTGGLKR